MKQNRLSQAKQRDLRDIIRLGDGEDSFTNYKAGYCPFHENDGRPHKTKSFLVYRDHYLCLSPSCNRRGDIVNWYAYNLFGDEHAPLKNGRFQQVLDAILGAPEVEKTEEVVIEKVETETIEPPSSVELLRLAKACYQTLLEEPRRLAYFYSRGFTRNTIREQMWGWDGKRYVVTVWRGKPRHSRLVTLRFRREDGSDDEDPGPRYSGIFNLNQQTLYNREAYLTATTNNLPLLVVYGEFDAQLAWQDRLPCVSPTNGALSFLPEWVHKHTGDKIFLPDKGEEKAAYHDAAKFKNLGWVAHLPKGDFKDYTEYRQSGGTSKYLIRHILRTSGIRLRRVDED